MDDEPVTLDTLPTVSVASHDGTVLATGSAALSDVPGTYTYLVPGQPGPDALTITWTGEYEASPYVQTTYVEVTGGRLFSIPDLRNSSSALKNTTKFPTSTLAMVRDYVENRFTKITGRRFVPSFGQSLNLAGSGSSLIYLNDPEWLEILSVVESGTDITTSLKLSHDDDAGKYALSIYDPDITNWAMQLAFDPSQRYDITYTYGSLSVPPAIATAALSYAAYFAEGLNSSMDPRTTAVQLPNFGEPGRGAVISMTSPDPASERFTGIPEIDAVLWEYRIFRGVG